jgi:hypothetical protein
VGAAIMIMAGIWGLQSIVWNYSMVRGNVRATRKITEEHRDTPIGAFLTSFIEADDEIRTITATFIILVGAEAYLAFLLFLPALLDHDKKAQAAQDQMSEAVKLLKEIADQYKPIEPAPNQEKEKAKR